MKNTFVDSKEIDEINSALDFVTVRNSEGRVVFMGERQNVKCFDRLKKVSDRVFETLAGQTYKFLDRLSEPKPKIQLTPEISPEMLARAEVSYQTCLTSKAWVMPAAQTVPEPPKPMTFEEQLAHDWRFNPGIRKEFTSFESYRAYKLAETAGKIRVCGRG